MSRPVRERTLASKLKDASNSSTPELSFQHKAVQDFHARQGQSSLLASEAGGRALSARSSFASSHISLSSASTPSRKRSALSSASSVPPSVPHDGDQDEDAVEDMQGVS